MNDFILPGAIPVGPTSQDHILGFHIKESRFNFDVTTNIKGKKVHGFLEMDFLLPAQGNTKVSNSYSPRLRHFFFEWNKVLVGQTWSNFMIVVLPSDLDFLASPDGLVFCRQAQIRVNLGSWSFSVENPETTYTSYKESTIKASQQQAVPDITVKKSYSGKRGIFEVAGIFRTLGGRDSTGTYISHSAFGITSGGKLAIGTKGDDLRVIGTYGYGLGRYLAVNFVSTGVLDKNRDIHPTSTINGYIAYNHFWEKDKFSSSFNIGAFNAFQAESLISPEANKLTYSASVNFKYYLAPQLMTGCEFMYGYRELVSGQSGSYNRVQVSAKYTFGYTDKSTIEK
jgi:hypothetical protein